MPDDALTLLRRARDVISCGCHYTNTFLARTAEGRPCTPHDARAVRWNAYGALLKASLRDGPFALAADVNDAFYAVTKEIHPGKLVADLTHEEAMSVFGHMIRDLANS